MLLGTRCTSMKFRFQTTDGAPEQFVSQRFDTVSSTRVRRVWVINWKTVCDIFLSLNRGKNTCDILLARYKRKSFLHRIVTGVEEWIYLENLDPGASSTSTTRPNRFYRKTMLCVWWNHGGIVYYELLMREEVVDTKHYQQQLTDLNHSLLEKRPNTERGNTK